MKMYGECSMEGERETVRVLSRFKSEAGEEMSSLLDLPLDVTVDKLQLICNALLKQGAWASASLKPPEPIPGTMDWMDFAYQREIHQLQEYYEAEVRTIEDMRRRETNIWKKTARLLKNDVRRLKITNGKMKRSQEAAMKKEEELRKELEAVKAQKRKLQVDKEALESSHNKEKRLLVQQNKELKDAMQTLKEQYDSEIKTVQQTHDREKRGWTKTNNQLKTNIRALKMTNGKLKKSQESATKIEEELQKELRALKVANDRLNSLLEFSSEERESLEKKTLELQEELQAMKTRVAANNMQCIGSSSEPQGHQYGAEPVETGEVKLSLDNFHFIKMLGKGAFGTVVLAKRQLQGGRGQLCAVKALNKKRFTSFESIFSTIAEKEALILASGHPFITSLHSCFQNKDHLFFVMEYVSGGDLLDLLFEAHVFSEERTQFYAAEITLALQFLHKHGILHRDLKLENVLVGSDGHLKVADLGLTKLGLFGGDKTSGYVGTPIYMAPEIVQDLPYGHAVDWWALGIMVFEMLVGYPPFDDDTEDAANARETLEYRIVNSNVEFPEGLPEAAVSVVRKLLKKNPAKRLGARGSPDKIRQHRFFAGIDWQALLEKRVDPPEKPEVPEVPEEESKDFSDLLKPDDTPCVIHQALFEGFSYIN